MMLRTAVAAALVFPLAGAHLFDGMLRGPLPDTGEQWISMNEGEEFQPAPSVNDPQLRHAQRRFLGYSDNFADGTVFYTDYAQAWRVLGWYIDCDQTDGDDHHRDLQENQNSGCRRYLLWAAYTDPYYEGSGLSEYEFWNRSTETWDSSHCKYADEDEDGGGSCRKMDCHLSDTSWKLLGFYKQSDWNDFFEQLFKHQAYCLWSSNQYSFMQSYRESWPRGCSDSGLTGSGGQALYLDIKPLAGGNMTLGLYSDQVCTKEYGYTNNQVMDLLSSKYSSKMGDIMSYWNYNMGIFSQCQPCVAYSLGNGNNNERRTQDDHDGDGNFQCDDAAGYSNVNQCMKFNTKTRMRSASLRDVELATREGTISDSYAVALRETQYESSSHLISGIVVFAVGLLMFGLAFFPKRKIDAPDTKDPLLATSGELS